MESIELDKNRKIFGKFCEDIASNYLIEKNYKILEKNFRHKKGEIDIIAKKNNLIVFIEVKGRKNFTFGTSESFVDNTKENLIIETAEEYIYLNNWKNEIRFDIIAIEGNLKNYKLTHFKDAFY